MTTKNVTLVGGPNDGETVGHDTRERFLNKGRNYYRRDAHNPTIYHHDPQTRQDTLVPLTDDPTMIRQAATLYRAAGLAGLPPTKTVAGAIGVSVATAGRLVRRARDENLLPEAARGRANFTDTGHRPRTARWSDASDSWLACASCREPWPCLDAIDSNAKEIST